MEALSVEQRLERLERLAGIAGSVGYIDLNKNSSALHGEAARSVPLGWREMPRYVDPKWHRPDEREYHGMLIAPEPVIPWGEEYEAILPEEVKQYDEHFDGINWEPASWAGHPTMTKLYPWRRRKSPAEPAPGSDAEHPPLGYRLEPRGGERRRGYLWWHPDRREWIPCTVCVGLKVEADIIANPIPANEGDSQKEDSIEDVIKRFEGIAQRLANVSDERDTLRATVERLTKERDELKKDLDHRCKIASRVKDRIDEIQEALG